MRPTAAAKMVSMQALLLAAAMLVAAPASVQAQYDQSSTDLNGPATAGSPPGTPQPQVPTPLVGNFQPYDTSTLGSGSSNPSSAAATNNAPRSPGLYYSGSNPDTTSTPTNSSNVASSNAANAINVPLPLPIPTGSSFLPGSTSRSPAGSSTSSPPVVTIGDAAQPDQEPQTPQQQSPSTILSWDLGEGSPCSLNPMTDPEPQYCEPGLVSQWTRTELANRFIHGMLVITL